MRNEWGCGSIILYAIIGALAWTFLPIILWIGLGYLIYKLLK
jgi:hypothetical protein